MPACRQSFPRNLGAVILTDSVNIRYSTGLDIMTIWCSTNLAHYVVLPAEGPPVIFEFAQAQHRSRQFWADVRPARSWQHRFAAEDSGAEAAGRAREIASLLAERGLAHEPIGVDMLDVIGFRALSDVGLALVDADEPLQAARRVKTKDEVELMRFAAGVAEAALFELEASIRPGVSERELLATFWHSVLRLGGEYCFTRLVASGERTNPWFQEASNRLVRPGDLVAIDTDMIGPEGYACDMSRTFVCGATASPLQREAYTIARDFVQALGDLLVAGTSYREVVERLPALPDRYRTQEYPVYVHGIGMDDESPFIGPEDGLGYHDGQLRPGMVVCVECYAGLVGGADGVKLEDEILVGERPGAPHALPVRSGPVPHRLNRRERSTRCERRLPAWRRASRAWAARPHARRHRALGRPIPHSGRPHTACGRELHALPQG